MPFQHKAEPTIVYRYGAKQPIEGLDAVNEQLHRAHRYRNLLTEIERRRRDAANDAVQRRSPELAALTDHRNALVERIADCRRRIKARRQHDRRRSAVPAELRQELADAKAAYREVREKHREAKVRAYESAEAQVELKAIDAAALAEAKAARAESGLYWGTYLQVEAAAQQARKSKAPPNFHRWTGEGKLAVQLQGGLSVEQAFACRDRRFRLEPCPAGAWQPGAPSAARRTTAWLRVGSDGRDPVWCKVPITLHRPLPEDATITWVYLQRRRVACHDRWSLLVSLARPEGWQKRDLAERGAVAVDVGWRLLDHGLRVAYWVGDDGAEAEVVVPRGDAQRWRKSEEIRSIRDRRLNLEIERLGDWLAGRDVPDWLVERTRYLRQWRSANRLAALAIAWRDQRFEGDAEGFEPLERWRGRDKHLYEWEANQRRKAGAWRLDLYRRIVADLSRRYHTAVVEDTKWTQLARKPQPEQADDGATRYWMRVASPGLLLQLVRQRFAETVPVPAEYTTQRCHACGKLAQFDARTHLWTKCRHCGAEWDQDANAARNLLAARGPVAKESPGPLE